MKYLLIIILLTSCGGSAKKEEKIDFDGIGYMKSLVSDLKINDESVLIAD